jgi:hypothetical protein
MEDLIPIVAIICVIGLPMLGLVARFALRPLVQDLTRAIRGAADDELEEMRERLARLETQISLHDDQIERLVETERFHRELDAGGDPSG